MPGTPTFPVHTSGTNGSVTCHAVLPHAEITLPAFAPVQVALMLPCTAVSQTHTLSTDFPENRCITYLEYGMLLRFAKGHFSKDLLAQSWSKTF